ncbi:hypothetical protein QBC38DRAFT_544848 [Podospora fimiseda]|uniref:Uncharacterized protein n=1 Tax=Podospora fimiseda TaxID=252190 RepID=A0AAN7BQV4_9PEZI|nr:hypothetical protein QBC38DRAFT_544848 [Podospora fimiseda]
MASPDANIPTQALELQTLPPPVPGPSIPPSSSMPPTGFLMLLAHYISSTTSGARGLAYLKSASDWLQQNRDIIVNAVLALVTLFLAASVVRPTLRAAEDGRISKQLAEWNSEKDFIEYCEAHPLVQGTCEIARNLTLPAPPGFPHSMWKRMVPQNIHTWTFIDRLQFFIGEAIRTVALTLSYPVLAGAIEQWWTWWSWEMMSAGGGLGHNPISLIFKIAVGQKFFNTSWDTSTGRQLFIALFVSYSPLWPFPIFSRSSAAFMIMGKIPGPVLELVFIFIFATTRDHVFIPDGLVDAAMGVMAKQTASYFDVDWSAIWDELVKMAEEEKEL